MSQQTKARTRKPTGKAPGPFARATAAKQQRQPDDVDLARRLLDDAQTHDGMVNTQRALGRSLTPEEQQQARRALESLKAAGLAEQPRGGAWRLAEAKPLETCKC